MPNNPHRSNLTARLADAQEVHAHRARQEQACSLEMFARNIAGRLSLDDAAVARIIGHEAMSRFGLVAQS